MVPLAPKLKVITYHFISYRRKSVVNLVEIQNIMSPFKLNMKLFNLHLHINTYIVYPYKYNNALHMLSFVMSIYSIFPMAL